MITQKAAREQLLQCRTTSGLDKNTNNMHEAQYIN